MIRFMAQPPADAAQILSHWKLPDSDLMTADWLVFCTWMENDKVRAIGGLERCGSELLLRSLAVAPGQQGRALGLALARALHQRARESGYESVYLLTLDKSSYFAERLGYHEIERVRAPREIADSSQFSGLCPDSATLMRHSL